MFLIEPWIWDTSLQIRCLKHHNGSVVVHFYPWFKFYFLLFLGIEMYDNDFETKENKIWTKDKIEPQQIYNVL